MKIGLEEKKRLDAQFHNCVNFKWLGSKREVEVYKMGLKDALTIIEADIK